MKIAWLLAGALGLGTVIGMLIFPEATGTYLSYLPFYVLVVAGVYVWERRKEGKQ